MKRIQLFIASCLLAFCAQAQRFPRVVDNVDTLINTVPSTVSPDILVLRTNSNSFLHFRYYADSTTATNTASPYVYGTRTGVGRWKEVMITGTADALKSTGDPSGDTDLSNKRYVDTSFSRAARKADTVPAMLASTGVEDGALFATKGRLVAGDGAAALYYYSAASTTATNRGTVFAATGMGSGRYLLLGDPADIRLWGALAGVSDAQPAIQNAVDTLTASTFGGAAKPRIRIPGYQYHVYSTITLRNPVLLEGVAIEANSVNVLDYSLNGSTLVSQISDGSPVIHVVGTDVGDGRTVIQGIEIENLGIDGSTTDGDGIWYDCDYNMSDVRGKNLVIRNVGGSAVRSGDGTRTGSPRWGYSRLEKITAIFPRRDGFEVVGQNNSSVSVVFDSLYVNGAGRDSFRFVNMGSFEANNLVENNAATLEAGYGMHLWNCNEGHFKGLYLEGDGRVQESGDSLAPAFSSAALLLNGSTKMLFQNAHFTSASGYLTNLSAGGLIHIKSSTASSGFSARDASGNIFENPYINSYVYGTGAATATAVGSGGSLSAGMYSYRVTSVYTNSSGYWETPLAAAGAVNTRAVANDSIILTNIPVADTTLGTLYGRKIWRTTANGATYKLLISTTNNVSTYSLQDTIADGSLSTNAVFSPLVLIESGNGQNRFEDAAFTASPLIVNNGPQNEFISSRVLTVDPNFQPHKGPSSFSSTTAYPNAARFFWGADSTGLLNGNGITRYQNKRADLLMPGYSSRAFGDESIGIFSATADAGTNRLTIGGNGTDYGLTEVVVNTTAANGTTTSRQVRIDSTGVAVDNALGVGGITTLTNDAIVGGYLYPSNNVRMLNGKIFQWKDNGGTLRSVLVLDENNFVQLGYASGANRTYIYSGTGGINMGQPGVSSPVYLVRTGTAASTNTAYNSQLFVLEASSFDTTEHRVEASARLQPNGYAGAADLIFGVLGTDRLQLKSSGNHALTGNLALSGDLSVGSTNLVLYLNADLLDGLNSTGFQPANSALTNYAAGTVAGNTATFTGLMTSAGVTVTGANDVLLPNGRAYRINGMIALYQSGSNLELGPGSGTGSVSIYPGTGGLNLGNIGVTGNINVKRTADATAGATLKDSRQIFMEGSAYVGGAAQTLPVGFRVSVDSTAPTYSYRISFNGTDWFILKSDGSLSLPVTTGTAPLIIASTTKVANLNVDLLDGIDSTGFQPASASLTNLAALSTTGTGALVRQDGSTITNASFGVAGSSQKLAGYDSNGNLSFYNVTKTEAEYLAGTTSAIQTQLNGKQASNAHLDDLADGTLSNSNLESTVVITTYQQTLTNKRVSPRAYALSFSTTLIFASDLYDVIEVGTMTGNLSTLVVSGTPTDGQELRVSFKQDGTGGRTVTWPANVVFGTDYTSGMMPTAANAKWSVTLTYNSADSVWRVTGMARGF